MALQLRVAMSRCLWTRKMSRCHRVSQFSLPVRLNPTAFPAESPFATPAVAKVHVRPPEEISGPDELEQPNTLHASIFSRPDTIIQTPIGCFRCGGRIPCRPILNSNSRRLAVLYGFWVPNRSEIFRQFGDGQANALRFDRVDFPR